MKFLFISVCFILLLGTELFAQKIDTINARVVSIKQLRDCYILSTFNKKTSDSTYIISLKKRVLFKCKYQKIVVGNEYSFICKSYDRPITPPNSFAMMVKNTIVWKDGDDPKKIPIYSTNMKGLYIRKK